VTFASLNYFAKVTPEVLAAWARLLKVVRGSRLILLPHTTASLGDYVSRVFAGHGIGRDRWLLVDRRTRGDYLALLSEVDIALDPFPFNGHTTTCDALWQGVPVVTLAGRTYAARFGSTAHGNLGLQELIAGSTDDYVAVAARLAGDIQRLRQLRGALRERMAASPLLDFKGFTRSLEAAYRQMWTDWCAANSA
jgi:predicted O-linked N-acetylglucosamine transferase (SPINDLY family)